MIGDRYSDIELAHNAGTHGALVLTGYGRGEYEHQRQSWNHQPDIVAEDLLEAIRTITATDNPR
jgi:D-glycero-D-manno-heptose 1,7-bisphosphate phosphatase